MPNGIGIKHEFAKVVKAWRRQLGISQENLAERAGLHRTYISDVERGARNLSLESINKLARALDLSISALFPPSNPQSREDGELSTGEPVEILLAEDDLDDVELTLRAFKKARFSNIVHVVNDGVEALDYVFSRGSYARHRHDKQMQVILLDLHLPRMNGLEVLRRIKAHKRTRKIPVVILTGSQRNRDIDECRRLGAETYLVKPVDFHRLSQVTPALNLSWALFRPQTALHA